MNEIFQSEAIVLLLRISLMLLAGCAAIAFFRKRSPALAIVISRFLLVGMWVGPLLILSGWTMDMPVLPSEMPNEIFAAKANQPPVVEPNLPPAPITEAENLADVDRAQMNNPSTGLTPRPQDKRQPPIDARAIETLDNEKIDDQLLTSDLGVSQSDVIASKFNAKDSDQFSGATVLAGNVSRTSASEAISKVNGTSLWSHAAFYTKPLLAAIWLLVTTILLIWFAIRISRTALVIRRSARADDQLSSALERVAKRMEIKRVPSIYISSEVSGPCTVGWFKPILLFPAKWLDGSESELTDLQFEVILAHELTHARSHDAVWDAIGQVTRALWWFHPLVTIVTRQHRLACEHCCDAAASQIAGDAQSYRRQLARWALAIRDKQDSHFASSRAELISLSMAQRPLMLKRLSWLKTGRLVERLSFRKRLIVLVGVALIGVLCAVVQPVHQLKAAAQDGDLNTVPAQASNQIPKQTKTQEKSDAENAAEYARLLGIEDVPAEDHVVDASRTGFGKQGYSSLELDWENIITVSCKVTNEAGEPISGAGVILSGLTDGNGKTGGYVVKGREGRAFTDERGGLKIKLPTGARRFELQIEAEGYVKFSDRFKVAQEIEAKMKSGRIVRVRATNLKGELLPDAYPIVGPICYGNREFKKQADGTSLSPLMSPDRRWMWVVDGSDEDEPILFSELIDLADEMLVDGAGIHHVELGIGTRLQGVLGDEVPRPIENGFVQVIVLDGEGHRLDGSKSLSWSQHARIQPDGSFVFESLPRDTHAQIFAICDGWQSKSPTRKSVEAYFKKHDPGNAELIAKTINNAIDRNQTMSQIYLLDSQKSPVQITVPCRQTTALDVRVVDPSGDPIVGAKVNLCPNVTLFAESIIPGWESSSSDRVRDKKTTTMLAPGVSVTVPGRFTDFTTFAQDSYLDVKTDATGLARLRNIAVLSDSFKVEAKGYVMSAHPTSTNPEKPGRYGLTGNMTPGKVKKMTITMERELKLVDRELTVVDKDGKAAQNIRLTITAIASDLENPDWQQWSVRRFGAPAKGETDREGNVRLLFPKEIVQGDVALLSVRVEEGRGCKLNFINKTLVVPVKPDGFGIRVKASEPVAPEKRPPGETRSERSLRLDRADEENSRRRRATSVEYVDILASNGASPKAIAKTLLQRKDLLSLRKLLAANTFDAINPLALKENYKNIRRIKTRHGERIFAAATFRPKSAKWKIGRGIHPPEAAFIFDLEGTLTNVIGSETTVANEDQNVALINLGGTSDFFVRISRFESHPPYNAVCRWYLVDEPEKPALTVYSQGSSSYAYYQGTNFPLAEYGFLWYWYEATGKNKSGVPVPCALVWDRATGKFYGELSQTHDSKPVYKVVVKESTKFETVSAKLGEVTVAGGRRAFQNWHSWNVVVPEGKTLTAKLELRDTEGKTLRLIQEDKLTSGLHGLQLSFNDAKPKKDDQAKENSEEKEANDLKTTLSIAVDPKDIQKDKRNFEIPHFTVDDSPTLKDHKSYLTTNPPFRIIEKQSTDKKQTLVWVIE